MGRLVLVPMPDASRLGAKSGADVIGATEAGDHSVAALGPPLAGDLVLRLGLLGQLAGAARVAELTDSVVAGGSQ